jgi:tetratricopeptide (TPR) repeat protein
MRYSRTCLVLVLLVALILGCSRVREATLSRGVSLFLDNNLQLALPVLEASARMSGDNPDAQAWLAECCRRLGRHDEAADAAYAALKLDPHHAFAHAVLGDLFAPHLSAWSRTDADSAWYHLREAVRYDPTEGCAWSSLWLQAMQRGEREIESRAAVQMIDSGFLSKPIIAYNRWQLEHLPENAILLTNGDMDTYPSVALQEKEALRTDVAVVNLSLLNLPWYARLVEDRYGVPLPFTDPNLDAKSAYKDEQGNIITVSMQVVTGWIAMLADGTLGRPLCAAVTVDRGNLGPDALDRLVLCGPYYTIERKVTGQKDDPDRLAESLENLHPGPFEGSFTSPVDRSPVRRTCSDRVATNVTAAMLRYAETLVDAGRWEEAESALSRAEDFDSRILARGACAARMDSLRTRIEYHPI